MLGLVVAAVLVDSRGPAPVHSISAPPTAEAAELSALHRTALAAEDGAQLGAVRALSPEIRNLARLSLQDDAAVDGIVRRWAATHAVALADTPAVAPQQRTRLRALQGGDFDRQYLHFNYGAQLTLHQYLAKGGAVVPADLRRSFGLYATVVAQDEFLSGWCLGHCVSPPEP